jgi:hypothetical protein
MAGECSIGADRRDVLCIADDHENHQTKPPRGIAERCPERCAKDLERLDPRTP